MQPIAAAPTHNCQDNSCLAVVLRSTARDPNKEPLLQGRKKCEMRPADTCQVFGDIYPYKFKLEC
jgi:hypothetical protein